MAQALICQSGVFTFCKPEIDFYPSVSEKSGLGSHVGSGNDSNALQLLLELF